MAPGIAEKKNNSLPLWGNEKTMNLNNLILTNILSSHYFKVNLYQLKTYHEVIDEIYYQVTHLEPWEKGSRKTSGQTGMCGGVRGVGAGGIVSTAFCILYKLFTLKLTRKQVVGLINHADSAYIRALGFMYIRYTQPPVDLWDWYENYLEDAEELDVKAGGGQMMSIGEMLRHFLSKLEWFSTLFPRIPVPIQKDLERKLSDWRAQPKNKALSETQETSEWVEESEQQIEEGEGWNEVVTSNERSSQNCEGKAKDFTDDVKDLKEKLDLSEEIAREKERQKREKDRHLSSSKSHHHSSERHKDHAGYRGRSRSPIRGSDSKSHREEDLKKHKKKHREKERVAERSRSAERSRHRSHENTRLKIHRKDLSDSERDSRLSKDKVHSHDKKDAKRHGHSHSHNHEKKHSKHSRNRDRY